MNFRLVGTVIICTTPGSTSLKVFANARMSESPRSGSRVMFDTVLSMMLLTFVKFRNPDFTASFASERMKYC